MNKYIHIKTTLCFRCFTVCILRGFTSCYCHRGKTKTRHIMEMWGFHLETSRNKQMKQMKYVNKHERVCWGFQVCDSFFYFPHSSTEVHFISLKLKVNVQTDELIPDQIINVEQRFPRGRRSAGGDIWRETHTHINTHTSTCEHVSSC